MSELLLALGAAAASFLASSLDNFILLVGMLAHPGLSRRGVAAGYVLAVAAVAITAFVVGASASLVPPAWLGYLGLVPLSLGLWHAIRPLIGSGRQNEPDPAAVVGGFISAIGVTLASSADSLMVYMALFADTSAGLDLPALATIVVCAVLWVAAAELAVGHRAIGELARRSAPYLVPLLMILLGLYILLDTSTDVIVP